MNMVNVKEASYIAVIGGDARTSRLDWPPGVKCFTGDQSHKLAPAERAGKLRGVIVLNKWNSPSLRADVRALSVPVEHWQHSSNSLLERLDEVLAKLPPAPPSGPTLRSAFEKASMRLEKYLDATVPLTGELPIPAVAVQSELPLKYVIDPRHSASKFENVWTKEQDEALEVALKLSHTWKEGFEAFTSLCPDHGRTERAFEQRARCLEQRPSKTTAPIVVNPEPTPPVEVLVAAQPRIESPPPKPSVPIPTADAPLKKPDLVLVNDQNARPWTSEDDAALAVAVTGATTWRGAFAVFEKMRGPDHGRSHSAFAQRAISKKLALKIPAASAAPPLVPAELVTSPAVSIPWNAEEDAAMKIAVESAPSWHEAFTEFTELLRGTSRTPDAFRKRANYTSQKLGAKLPTGPRFNSWTDEEVQVLRNLVEHSSSWGTVFEEFNKRVSGYGRTQGSLSQQAYERGIRLGAKLTVSPAPPPIPAEALALAKAQSAALAARPPVQIPTVHVSVEAIEKLVAVDKAFAKSKITEESMTIPAIPAIPAIAASSGVSRTIKLRCGGVLTLSLDVDLFDLDGDDRELVFSLIDQMKKYEKKTP